jgi:hypothetical protein
VSTNERVLALPNGIDGYIKEILEIDTSRRIHSTKQLISLNQLSTVHQSFKIRALVISYWGKGDFWDTWLATQVSDYSIGC